MTLGFGVYGLIKLDVTIVYTLSVSNCAKLGACKVEALGLFFWLLVYDSSRFAPSR